STARRTTSAGERPSLNSRWIGLVARNTWQRRRGAGRSASLTRSMSSRLARARAQTVGPSISRATAATASKPPGDAAGKPAPITASTSSGSPVISTVSVAGETSTTRARKSEQRRRSSARFSGGADAFTSANSRDTAAPRGMSCTCSTSTSFSKLACTRRAVSSSAWTTSAIREMPGRSVLPTVSEAMLNPRRRNSDTTRLRAPGRSSTVATNVWATALFIGSSRSRSRVGPRLEHGRGAADHVAQVRVGRDHRVDAVFLLDAEIDDRRARSFAGARDRASDFLPRGDAQAAEPVRLGELDEVRAAQRGRDVAAAVEELLPLPHHPKKAVVDDRDVQLDSFLRAGGQLAGGHLEAAVAGDDPDLLVRPGEARADRGGQGEAHRPQSAGGDQGARPL